MAVEGICTNVGTKLAEMSVNKAIEEAGYLCCYQSYVDDFDDQRKKLSDEAGSVREDIKDARARNETRIDPVVQGWLDEADALIQQDTKAKKKWFFGLCLNCYWQNRRSKELKVNTQVIRDLITRRSNLPPVARSAESLGIELYSSPDFMRFESRKLKIEQLQESLKDESNHMIGLQGMGGTGKTTMAAQVGKELQQLKVFDKVIFTVVSNANQPADVIKIRGDIARQLKFKLEGEESEHAYQLLTRICTGGEKILIVLDDVWQKLPNLTDYGIPLGQHEKGRCSVLITTRNLRVLRQMGCQMEIRLEPLSGDDALKLFLFHSGKSGEDDFKDVALRIVNECGRLPVAIVPLARALYSGSLEYWNDTLTRLQNFNPMSHDVPEDLIDAYKSLRLSYDNLKEYPSAQKLFLLCSLFPEDFEIPVELLTRIAISMGLCVEADKYYIARSQVSDVQSKLLDSCLLSKVAIEPDRLNFSEFVSKATNKRVKMHDLIREVALWIAKEEIQVILDSKSTLKENIQWSSWNINGFPDRFDGGELQFLLLMIKTEEDSIQVPDGLFKGVMNLRVLLLICTNDSRIPAPSLMKSTLPLVNIQTLLLSNWELGDISVIGILQSLETLELIYCSITELPGEVAKLKKLRLLGLRDCEIDYGNPFKVIERCPILEELYYVQNEDRLYYRTDELDHIHIEPPATLEKYHIVSRTYRSVEVDDSISRWFQPGYLSKIFSEATFKSLATRAEILGLEIDDGRWTNVIPEIDPMEGMKNLIKLSLKSCPNMKSLIHLDHLHSDLTIFSKLVRLELYKLNVEELFRGPLPVDLLKKLEVLKIEYCGYLEGTLLKGKLELGNLRSIRLKSCAVTFLFDTSTAQSLKKLETLEIRNCSLKCIIADERSNEAEVLDDPNQKGHGSLFNLKFLQVEKCPNLEFIFPIYFAKNTQKLEEVSIDDCEELEYIFGQYSNAEEGSYQIQNQVILPSLKEVNIWSAPKLSGMFGAECCIVRSRELGEDGLKEKDGSKSGTNNAFSWPPIPISCFFPKSRETLPDHTTSQTQMLIKAKKGFNIAGCLMRTPLNPSFVTQMTINECSNNLTSLFTLAVASSMSSLEDLYVGDCNGLKHIVSSAEEGDGDDHMNHNSSIFPNLRDLDVGDCELLEDVFPASHCTKLHHLKFIRVTGVPKLRYVFGKCSCQNQNVEILLPALKQLSLSDAPNLVNICTENYFVKASSLEHVNAGNVPQHVIRPLIDFRVGQLETQDITTRKVIEIQPGNLTRLYLDGNETDRIYDLEGLQTEGPVKSRLNVLYLENLPLLTDICVGTRNILSFQNLDILQIYKCKKLQFIFSASILRSLPQLEILYASECPELLQIIEEDTDENSPVSQQTCFPQLKRIDVEKCDKLKCLFSITECGILPNLEELTIKEAPELMQVFGCKQGDSKELKHVFPQLSHLQLVDLQSLESVCQGIDFHLVPHRDVSGCPKICLTSTTEENPSKTQESQAESQSVSSLPYIIEQETNQIVEDTSKRSPNMTKIHEIEEVNAEDGPKLHDSITPDQTILSESSKPSQAPCVIPYPQNESLQNIEVSIKEGPSSEKENKPTSPTHSGLLASTNNIEVLDSLEKDNEATSSTSTKRVEEVTKSVVEEESANQEQNHGPLNLDTVEASAQDSPKLNESTQELVDVTSQNESTQDTLVDKDAKNESTTKGLRAAADSEPDMNSNDSQNNIEVKVAECPSLEKDDKQSSSTNSKINVTHPGSSYSTKICSIASSKEPQTETATTKVESEASQSNQADVSGKADSPKGQILINQTETNIDEEIKVAEEFEEDDLFKLFRIMEAGGDMEASAPYVSKIVAVEDDNKVAKAFADLEASLKMDLNEVATSEENSLSLQNALHFLSTYCFEDGTSSHGISATIDSLLQEIQSILSSFKQASSTIHTFTDLEEKEKFIDEEIPRRKQAAKTLYSEIYENDKSVVEAKKKRADLKEKISIMQAELDSKEEEIKDREIKLLSLQDQKKKCVSETIGFMKEFESVKKGKSQMVEEQIKARKELEKVNGKWSSCVANLRKTKLLLGLHINHKL